jgi:hypothetical protein
MGVESHLPAQSRLQRRCMKGGRTRNDELEQVPDVSNVQRSLDDLVKRVRKLRWIGRPDDALKVQMQLIERALAGDTDIDH